MKSLFFVLAIVIILTAVGLVLLKRRWIVGPDDRPWPFYLKRPLSQPEQVLYHRLIRALPEHIVLAQVQVSRILGVKKGFNFHEWNNRINRLSYDFVVCAKDSSVLAAIELDDSSHDSKSRIETDQKKAKATTDAGVRLIRWHVKALPEVEAIRSAFEKEEALRPIEEVTS